MKNILCGKELIKFFSPPPPKKKTVVTTFAYSSVFIFLLWGKPKNVDDLPALYSNEFMEYTYKGDHSILNFFLISNLVINILIFVKLFD